MGNMNVYLLLYKWNYDMKAVNFMHKTLMKAFEMVK